MTKYLIKKYTQNESGGFRNIESKKVKGKNLQDYIEKGWVLTEKITPIKTPINKWWKKFTTSQKIAIFAIIVPCFAVVGWISDKYHSQNADYKQLKRTLIQTSDSLKIEREKTESLKKQLQSSTPSGMNQTDKNK